MSNEIKALLERVESADPATAKALRRHIDSLQGRRQFGLNFERHTPESVALTGRPISVGDKVRFLPERGQTEVVIADEDSINPKATWLVTKISGPKGKKIAELLDPRTKATTRRDVEDLVFVADFRDPIYPGLVRSGEPVLRGGDKPFHTVINAENYHALEAMLFTSRGKVDCIYIDPPYNTRANDWKYNNDYVDPGDSYAHSKWLAFMERRLKVAGELLNPQDSALIVTIDEKEYLRLGLLLEQLFTEAQIQMVSTVTNRKGNPRRGEFSRCEEYLYIVRFGGAKVSSWSSNMLMEGKTKAAKVRWKSLLRLASTGRTSGRFNLFYPLFFEKETRRFLRAGKPLREGEPIDSVAVPEGESVLWPISDDGSDGRWSIGAEKLMEYWAQGFISFGGPNGGGRTPYYLMSGQIRDIENGVLVATGKDADGALVFDAQVRDRQPMTIWNVSSHSTSGSGTSIVKDLLPGRSFPYPKSLYAVEDALRFFVKNKPDALIVDFFSGSGTTAHAVMRLNHQDGGCRRSISVTNNEVNDQETALLKKGLRQGDPDWEALGICERVTKPRIRAAVTGLTPEREPVEGDYKFTEEFPIADGFEENVEFFTLTYENPAVVEVNLAFERIAPLLWIRAGSRGRIIAARKEDFDATDTYAVLFSVDAAEPFLSEVAAAAGLRLAYIVTDDEPQFQAIAGQLPDGVKPVRLYESYLRTFEINNGRA